MSDTGNTARTWVPNSAVLTAVLVLAAGAAIGIGRGVEPRAGAAAAAVSTPLGPIATPTIAVPSAPNDETPDLRIAPTEAPASVDATQAVVPSPIASTTPPPPAPEKTAAPVALAATPAPSVAPTPSPKQFAGTCPADWFCYPRLGVAGPIVPYTDCSGSTDVGTSIRSYTCLSDNYLMGHAYTSFGRVRDWKSGDVVFARGKSYTVTGATIQSACAAPAFPLAPLSMQTSLTSQACGQVLVVQAR